MKKTILIASAVIAISAAAYFLLPSNKTYIEQQKPVSLMSSPEEVVDNLFTTDYYVRVGGGGSNAGTLTNPWTSLASVNWSTVASGGGELKVNRGDTFNEAVTVGASGISGTPITVGTYGTGANPIISGFETVSSWSSIGGGIYEAVLAGAPSTCNMVTINGVFQPIGRYPKLAAANSGYLDFQSHTGITAITSNAIASVPSFVGGEVVIRYKHWMINRGTITAQTSTVVTYTQITGPYSGSTQPDDGFGFFFQNDLDCLTTLGDWMYDGVAHKIKMYFGGATPGSYTIKASVRQTVLTTASKSYLTFNGISFQGGNLNLISHASSNNIIYTNCDFKFGGQFGILCTSSACSNMSLINSTMSYCNSSGIEGRVSTVWTITGNTIDHIASIAGMGLSGDGTYNALNEIGQYSIINTNTIKNIGYIPVQIQGGGTGANGTTVYQNYIDTFCYIKDDGGGVYSVGGGATKKVLYNVILNGLGAGDGTVGKFKSASGVYMDDNSSYFDVTSNTVANCAYSGFHIHNGANIGLANNTAYNNGLDLGVGGGVRISHDSYGGPISNIVMQGNIFFATTTDQPVAGFANIDNNMTNWGTWNRNYYCRPINEISRGHIILTDLGGNPVWRSLANWKSFSGLDGVSRGSPILINNLNKLRFEYNATQIDKVVALGSTIYKNVKGATFTGNITLKPFTSQILINTQ